MTKLNELKVAFVGNYLPRKCGIATFTHDLENAINSELLDDDSTIVVAMNNRQDGYDYPDKVKKTIFQQRLDEYREAAEFLNRSDAGVVSIQHEFGIYGGEGGEFVVEMMRHIKKPMIVTLHTIFRDPPEVYKRVTRDMAALAHGLVVMSERAVGYLENSYGIPARKIRMIHHGVPSVGFSNPDNQKAKFGFENRTVVGTFGLLGRNKGIEYVIRSLPEVVKKHPDLLYVVLGETHPEVVKHEGESYRDSLINMAEDLGVSKNVEFISKFLTLNELVGFLQAVDIYVTPYQGREQITSGTLAYSLAAGKPIISTPYWYAQELLDKGRGVLVDFGENNGIGDALIRLLDNPEERETIRQKAFKFGRQMAWPNVAQQYVQYFKDARRERIVFTAPVAYSEIRETRPVQNISLHMNGRSEQKNMTNGSIPRLSMTHLRVLTDDTGIIQHAIYSVPDRHTGYCMDDNSRALIAAIKAQEFFQDPGNLALAKTYLSFIHYAQTDDGRFHNFMNYERRFLDEVGSEDSFGRTIWALGFLIGRAPSLNERGMDQLAQQIFEKAIPNMNSMISPRAWAYTMLGLHHYLKRFPGHGLVLGIARDFADRLVSLYKAFSNNDWKWFEPIITYDNGKLPQALFHAGEIFKSNTYTQIAHDTLDFLTNHLFDDGIFSPIGTEGWLKKGNSKAEFDQQPIEGSSMIDAYYAAANSSMATALMASGYESLAEKVWNWYMGRNILESQLYDPTTGACADGLGLHEISLNQGAESTIAAVMSLQSMREHLKSKTVHKIVHTIDTVSKKTAQKQPTAIEAN